jgi:hypothetical protein
MGPAVLFWSYLIVVIIAATGLGKENLTPLQTRQWLLLGLGITQIPTFAAIIVVLWLLALGFRKKRGGPENALAYNFTQFFLVILTFAALVSLYTAIEKGLLGIPHMQIAGNGSSNYSLNWTQDRVENLMPQPFALALHQGVYHFLMLIWALWLAFSLLKWLRWGWNCFSGQGLWKKIRLRKRKVGQPPPLNGN